jgi:chromosome segregation ATPase
VSDRRGRAAELRAERIRWKGRSRNMSQASRSLDKQLRQMNEQASGLDKHLGRHAEERAGWHKKWDDHTEA